VVCKILCFDCQSNSLSISGSLQIKIEAIGGGGQASASFLDSNKFKESDINYFIQVHVTNQHLTAPDLTEFTSIPNVPSSEFNRVYGDFFISGKSPSHISILLYSPSTSF
jgi:hypothetical protein